MLPILVVASGAAISQLAIGLVRPVERVTLPTTRLSLSRPSTIPISILHVASPRGTPSRPQTRQHDLLKPRLHAPFVEPSMQPCFDQLCDLRYVLQT